MFIQTEETPNPMTMKFIPGKDVMGDSGKTIYFKNSTDAKNSPLAISLFDIEGVEGVFLGSDFLTITVKDMEWSNIKPSILGVIMNHFVSETPILFNENLDSVNVKAFIFGKAKYIIPPLDLILSVTRSNKSFGF